MVLRLEYIVIGEGVIVSVNMCKKLIIKCEMTD